MPSSFVLLLLSSDGLHRNESGPELSEQLSLNGVKDETRPRTPGCCGARTGELSTE